MFKKKRRTKENGRTKEDKERKEIQSTKNIKESKSTGFMDSLSVIFRQSLKMRMPFKRHPHFGTVKEILCYAISIHIHSHYYFRIQNHHYHSSTGLR
jgi:hypothetical protein